jgi:hypothetical protein
MAPTKPKDIVGHQKKKERKKQTEILTYAWDIR